MDRAQWMRRTGWTLFAAMWVPFTLIFIGMIGMPEGSYSWEQIPMLTRIGMIGTGVLASVSMVLLLGSPLAASMANRRVTATGLDAEAVILSLTDTGTTINENPVVRFLVEVHPHEGDVFEAEFERLVSRLDVPRMQPGAVIRVKYDPESNAVATAE